MPSSREMKLHTHKTIDDQTIVFWFDPSYGWCIQTRDPQGYEIRSDYVGPRSALSHGLNFAEYMITSEDK